MMSTWFDTDYVSLLKLSFIVLLFLSFLAISYCDYTVVVLFQYLQAKRQARKLNFLITQTELYAHFMAKKITGAHEEEKDKILNRLDEKEELQLHSSVLDDYGTWLWS